MATTPATHCPKCGTEKTVYRYGKKAKRVCLPCAYAYVAGRRIGGGRNHHIHHKRNRPNRIEDVIQQGMLVYEGSVALAHTRAINALQDELERELRADIRAEIREKIARAVAEYDAQCRGVDV